MGVDVAWLLAQQELEPTSQPMHGQRGEIRRNPSSDQKKVRRQMSKKAAENTADNATIALLLKQASNPATPEPARAELLAEVERLKTARLGYFDAERALDLTVHEAVEIVPRGTHELHTGATDWLIEEGLRSTASASEAEQALVAEASMWFARVPDYVKVAPDEFGIQARNYARRTASQYGDSADAAAEAFVREAARLHRQAVKTGSIKVAILAHDLDGDGMTDFSDPSQPSDPTPQPANQDDYTTNTHDAPKSGPHLDASIPDMHGPDQYEHPLTERTIQQHMTGEDAAGVGDMSHGFAQQQVHGRKVAARAAVDDDAALSAVLAGLDKHSFLPLLLEGAEAAEGAAATESAAGEGAGGFGMPKTPGMPGGGHGGGGGSAGGLEGNLDASSNGVGQAAENFAQQQVTGASQVPQVGSSGYPTSTFPTFSGQDAEPNTSSNRAPALEELAEFTGWNGTSVVPSDSGEAETQNQGLVGNRDATAPVHTASMKESTMTEHAQCPTCGGHGKVAVRKQAYSGLPQIDEIVAADDSPRQDVAPGQTEHFPEQVAFPVNPNWGTGADVQSTIQQTEQQIADRNARSPLVSGTTASQYVANGRDNSGWIGDAGARGTDYPGESAPVGYDGSSNLGQPDPVYGFGGEQGDRPLRPHGEEEAADETNNPSQVPFPTGGGYDAAQAYRSVTPAISTQGSRDPYLSQIEAEMLRLQQVHASRIAQLHQQG